MKTYLVGILTVLLTSLQAQTDSSYVLPEVHVKDHFSHYYLRYGGNFSSDSLPENQIRPANLSELNILKQQGYRNYGPGRLSTLAFRGASAQHTALFWEGIPINNPMLGLADLSNIGLGNHTVVDISQGLWATHMGMGSTAGAIHLKENLSSQNKLRPSAEIRMASFGNYSGNVSVDAGNKKLRNSITFLASTGENDFSHDYFGNERTLPNAAHENFQGKWVGELKLTDNHQLGYGSWLTSYRREIPPTRLQSQSLAVESGESWRNFIRHQWNLKRSILSTTVSYQEESFTYEDPSLNLNQRNRVSNWFIQQKLAGSKRGWEWTGGWEIQRLKVFSPNYSDHEAILRGAIFMRSNWQVNTNELILKVRQDISTEGWGLPVLTGMVTGKVGQHTGYFIGAGSIFRWPSLDDLFWTPGGDPNLDPEYGWNAEAGLSWDIIREPSNSWYISLSSFLRNQYDAIQWYPEGSLWEVGNRGTLRSYGAILQTEWKYESADWFLYLRSDLQFIKSDRLDNNDGFQEIYVPMFSGAMETMAGWKRWAFGIDHNFRSSRYFLNEATSKLPAVLLSDIRVSYKWPFKSYSFRVAIGCENVAGVNHEWVINRPMPGRTYFLSLQLM